MTVAVNWKCGFRLLKFLQVFDISSFFTFRIKCTSDMLIHPRISFDGEEAVGLGMHCHLPICSQAIAALLDIYISKNAVGLSTWHMGLAVFMC